MEQTSRIIMQCPKCRKEFPVEATYCETCSAMLEPVEITVEKMIPGNEIKKQFPAVSDPENRSEKIEDIKIDSLKTDIEKKFVLTLLKELGQLKSRLSKKEKFLSDMNEQKTSMEFAGQAEKTRKSESDIEGIIRRTAKLESIIENLKKKIEAEIEELRSKLEEAEKPGISGFFSNSGRYHKMLSSELKAKNLLMNVIKGEISPAKLKYREFSKGLSITFSFFAIVLFFMWILFDYRYKSPDIRNEAVKPVQTENPVKFTVSEKDIHDLLDDIKTANLTKNLELWESRYSKGYLELEGKKENILEQWKKFSYKSLDYRIDKIEIKPEAASAHITWDMVIETKKTGRLKAFSHKLHAFFLKENGKLKIASVSKEKR
ncbi:MAG: hypothetical protein AB1632_00260 [Nitrospirota bacterium]